jgi:uncharacterized protein YbaR (Trm112 family)
MRVFDTRLLDLLVCPVTKTCLEYRPKTQALVSRAAKLIFPIRDGVPILVVDEAEPLKE